MKMSKVTSKKIEKETATPNWITAMKEKSKDAQTKFMENGKYFNGRAGEVVRAILLDAEMVEGETQNGSPIWKIQVLRLSSNTEQTLSILQSITKVTDQIVDIAMKNNGSLKELIVDVKFIAGKGQMNYIDTITQVFPAEVN
jgi:hypothetical protein